MRLTALSVLMCLVLAGCEAQAPTIETRPSAPATGPPSPEERSEPSFDGWTVRVSVEPGSAGPIELAVGPFRLAPASDSHPALGSHPWIEHEVRFLNGGDRIVRFEDTRISRFLRRAGEPVLLVADEGCGYVKQGKKPVEPGACLLYLDAFTVRPGSTARRTITLFKELRGMESLAGATYTWRKVIRFRVGSEDAPVRTATIRLTYELAPAGG
jgi:hypothetical protein